MYKRKKSVVTFVLTFLVLCFIGTAELPAGSGAERVSNPVADEIIGPNGITWVPRINYRQLVLTVSRPDGTVFTKTIESGSAPHVDLSEIFEGSFTNGSYTYQLTVIPVVERKIRKNRDHFLTSGSKNERTPSRKASTQSGAFTVQGGAIVLAGIPEPGASKTRDGLGRTMDVCHNDDLIVDGSLCVGFDCTCNYAFGFDTIVLKENNLRIFFDDTSNSASFPRNDWRIIINDSTNGGAAYFGIEDSTGGRRVFTLEAGAPTHSLYVDDGGRVGLGTSTPVADVHIKSGNTPTLRLEQDGSSGFTPQTFDVAGNETNFFVRDATNGSTLPFRIQPDAPSNVLTLKADGKIGMGTWGPSYQVHLKTDSSTGAQIVAEKASGATMEFSASTNYGIAGTKSDHPVRLRVNDAQIMQLNGSGNYIDMIGGGTYNGTWNPSSSRELKDSIENLAADEAVEALEGLNPVKFHYKTNKEEARVGFISEDVPELVAMNGKKTLGTVDIMAVLTKVLQEQQKLVQKQQKTISELKKEIAELKKK